MSRPEWFQRDLVAVSNYIPRYRPERRVVAAWQTPNEAAWHALVAGWRIIDELFGDGITVGAEEDAEDAIFIVNRMSARAPMSVVALAALLVRALDEIRSDEGIGASASRLVEGIGSAELHYKHPSWGHTVGTLLRVDWGAGRVLVHDRAPNGAREWWPIAEVRVELRGGVS